MSPCAFNNAATVMTQESQRSEVQRKVSGEKSIRRSSKLEKVLIQDGGLKHSTGSDIIHKFARSLLYFTIALSAFCIYSDLRFFYDYDIDSFVVKVVVFTSCAYACYRMLKGRVLFPLGESSDLIISELSINDDTWLALIYRCVPAVQFLGGIAIIFYTFVYQKQYFCWILFFLNLHMMFWMLRYTFFGLIASTRIKSWLDRDWALELQSQDQQIEHVVILPNYKEELSVLMETVQSIAQATGHENITLVLEMEEREGFEETTKKVRMIQDRFSNKFQDILASYHPTDIAGETPGKSSNTQWAFMEARRIFLEKKRSIKSANTIITVSDADSLWHPDYFAALSVRALSQAPEARVWTFWQPPIWLLRNYYTVPSLTRVSGVTTSLNEMGSLANPFAQHIIFSSYSLTWQMAESVNGWCSSVIAEDHHMFCKCLIQSAVTKDKSARLRLEPIWLPVKGYMVEAEGYFSSLKARFIQAIRHNQGNAEYSYLGMAYTKLLQKTHFTQGGLHFHPQVFQTLWAILCTHLFPSLHTIIMILAVLSKIWVSIDECKAAPHPLTQASCYMFIWNPFIFALPAIFNILGVFSIACCCLNLRRANSGNTAPSNSLWHTQSGGDSKYPVLRFRIVVLLRTVFEMLVLGLPTVIAFSIIPEIIAVIMIMRCGTIVKYVVAEKPKAEDASEK